jgi:hypothetical protein
MIHSGRLAQVAAKFGSERAASNTSGLYKSAHFAGDWHSPGRFPRPSLQNSAQGYCLSAARKPKTEPFCTASYGNNVYCSASPGRFARVSETEKAPMRALLIISMIFAVTSLTARASVTYTITSYPGGLADLPCDAFEKNADGSWTQVAILVAGGALIPAGNRFKDSAETRIIEKKCNKQ